MKLIETGSLMPLSSISKFIYHVAIVICCIFVGIVAVLGIEWLLSGEAKWAIIDNAYQVIVHSWQLMLIGVSYGFWLIALAFSFALFSIYQLVNNLADV